MRRAAPVEIRARAFSNHVVRGGMLAAILFSLLLLTIANTARSQSCPLSPRVPFVGHNLPLDSLPDTQPMTLVRAFSGLSFVGPVGLGAPKDSTNRIFIWERGGRILVFENQPDVASMKTFLDISLEIVAGGTRGELGLLGLAFDPDYETNGRFYVNYTATNCSVSNPDPYCTKIVRYEVSSADPDQADPDSAFELLEFPQFEDNHNGGALEFGPDGMLYIATGDGGGGGDPMNNGQDITTRLGALLRIDVREGAASIIPADNPFVNTPGAEPTIFHYGLRNPWRVTFDRATGDLYIADVGQNQREEVNFVPAGTPGGLNFGWNYCEGTADFRAGASCSDIVSELPVIEYAHDAAGGNVIIGGYVYRDDEFPELQGAYIYHDAASRRLWAWDRAPAQDPASPGNPGVLIASDTPSLNSFGEDLNGRFYALGHSPGHVYKLQRTAGGSTGTPVSFPTLLSETGLFSDVGSLTPMPGVIEFDVASPAWSYGAEKSRWIALPGESRITFHSDQALSFPIGTAFVKHFELPLVGGGVRRVETRVLVRQKERWVGVTYRWNALETDADLLTEGFVEEIDLGDGQTQSWVYPSSADCLSCHSETAGRVLGFRTRQLGESFDYPGGSEIQLEAFNCGEYFDFDIRNPGRYSRVFAIDDLSVNRTSRIRSYYATNCEMCHQPTGSAPGGVDFRFTSAVSAWNVLDVDPTEGDLGLVAPKRIAVGAKAQSVDWVRQQSSDLTIKMAPGTINTELTAVAVVGNWIDFDTSAIDSDRDGSLDENDNCPAVANQDQVDGNVNGIGDVCDPQSLPKLAVFAMDAPNEALHEGDVVELTAEVENLGGGDAGDFPVTFYLSADTKYDPGLDSPSGSCWIEFLEIGTQTECNVTDATIPKGLVGPANSPESMYWIACANSSRVQREADEMVDCRASAESILVPEPSIWLMLQFGSVALVLMRTSRVALAGRVRDDQTGRGSRA